MQSICFIAARAGSKGVPNKNIRKIHGLPLIAYTIKSAKISGLFKNMSLCLLSNSKTFPQ